MGFNITEENSIKMTNTVKLDIFSIITYHLESIMTLSDKERRISNMIKYF